MHEHRVHVHNEVTCFVPIQRQCILVHAHTYIAHLFDCHTWHSTSAAYKLSHQHFLVLGRFNGSLNRIYYLSNRMSYFINKTSNASLDISKIA